MNVETSSSTNLTPARSRGERRRTPRVPLDLHEQVFVRLDGAERPAVVADASTGGAGLSVADVAQRPEVGQEIELVIQAHGQRECRRGRVAWAVASGTTLRFGVEFVGLCADAECIGLLNVSKISIDPSWRCASPRISRSAGRYCRSPSPMAAFTSPVPIRRYRRFPDHRKTRRLSRSSRTGRATLASARAGSCLRRSAGDRRCPSPHTLGGPAPAGRIGRR